MNGPSKEDKRFQAESDLRTLVEAERIRGDKKRSDAAMKIADEQRTALDNVKKEKSNGK